jgi:predicted transcriptional regulator
MSKTQSVPVRVDESLRGKLQAAADKERRPLSQYIRNLLADAAERAGSDAGAHAA